MSDTIRRARYILSAEDQTKPALASVNRGLAGLTSALGTLGLGLSAAGFVAFAKQAGDAAMQLDRLENRFRAATGSFEAGRRELEFVRQVAGRLGLDLMSAADSYSSLTAAAAGTSLAGQGVRDVFESVAQTSAILGLSSEQTQGALLALEQMMSKGTVQAEELKGQLGERIPGAFRIAAEAMGVTTAELGKMLEQGQVVADDFLPKFATALRNNYQGEIPEHVKALNTLKTEFFEFSSTLGRAGVQDTVVWGLTTATEALGSMRGAVDDLSAAFLEFPEDNGLTRTMEFIARGSNQIVDFVRMGFGAHINDPRLAEQNVPGLPAYLRRESSLGGADNLDPTADRLPFAVLPPAAPAESPSPSPLGKAGKQPKSAKDTSPKPFDEPLTTIGQAGVWESIAQAQIEAQNRSLAAQIEFDEQRFAGAIESGNQIQDVWIEHGARLLQLTQERESSISEAQRVAEEERYQASMEADRLRFQAASMASIHLGTIFEAANTLFQGKAKALFIASRAAAAAGAIINGHQAAAAAVAPPPLGLGPVFGPPLSAIMLAGGYINAAAIMKQAFDGSGTQGAGGSFGGGTGGYGGGTPNSPVVVQPSSQQQTQQDITIRLIGGVSDAYVENEIIPRINSATSRNVRIEFVRD